MAECTTLGRPLAEQPLPGVVRAASASVPWEGMPPWLCALIFVGVLLALGWVVDRRNKRIRQGLVRLAARRLGGARPTPDRRGYPGGG